MKYTIACAFNKNMQDASIIALYSLFKNGSLPESTEVIAYVDSDVDKSKFNFLDINIRDVNIERETNDPHAHYHDKEFIRGASLAAPAIDDLYREGRDRVVWIDMDIFIRKSVQNLITVDLGEHSFAACRDFHFSMNPQLSIDYDFEYKTKDMFEGYYFNSGIMVFDLQQFYIDHVLPEFECLTDIIIKSGHEFRFMDQCMFNSLICDFYTLPQKYNWFPDWFLDGRRNKESYDRRHLAEDAAIIHFVGAYKPWKLKVPEGHVKQQMRIDEYYQLINQISSHLEHAFITQVRENTGVGVVTS
ncbi:glycosyltransferase family 8 protein [Vibrio sp. WXL103]|uniref:glycosyltransferase family 8 protein n=1 Tax=Vibrio sp. WXL103 TaxID=3450710 RepID=UPI003EC7DED0